MDLLFLLLPVALAISLSLALSRRLALVFVAHAAAMFALSRAGLLDFQALPPRIPLLALATVGLGVALGRTARLRARLAEVPLWWAIAAQVFRAPLELALFALHRAGEVPQQLTFAGRNFDLLVGLSAPAVAWLVARRRLGPRAVAAWNALGAASLVNVVGVAISSAPGPLHGAWPGEPFTLVQRWPFVLLPTLLVPLAALGHLAVAARLRRRPPPREEAGAALSPARPAGTGSRWP